LMLNFLFNFLGHLIRICHSEGATRSVYGLKENIFQDVD
jgi:hypothetical protein